jgi:small subunit ribosomal protein S6
MALYESVFIARQDISAAQVEALAQKITEIITAQGGKVTKNEYWGLKNLAYRIKKNRKGHYTLLNIDAPAAAIKEMERNMRIDEDVLRYLTVRVEELEEGPSAMLRSREDRGRRFDRDDRGDRGDRFGRGGDRGGRGEWRDRPPRAGGRRDEFEMAGGEEE